MKLSEVKSFLRIPVVYGIQNTVTLQWYIGSCNDMKDRFQRHKYYLRHNKHHSSKLQRAYNKYGEDSFEVHVLHFITNEEDRFKLEQDTIEKYNSVEEGYNMLKECIYVNNFVLSDSAKKHFMEYIKTLEKSVIAIDRYTGEIENTFKSVSEAAKYYKTSSSNVSRVCKGTLRFIKDKVFVYTEDFDATKEYTAERHAKNKPKSFSQRYKMSLSSKRSVTIYQYDKNMNLITEYRTILLAAAALNINEGTLRHRIKQSPTGNIELNGFIITKTKYDRDIV